MKLFKWIYKYFLTFKKTVKYENKDEPTEIDKYGSKCWRNYKGLFHREDGPAYEGSNGSKQWWINGKPHRVDGPALEYASDGFKEWYINGRKITLDTLSNMVIYNETI